VGLQPLIRTTTSFSALTLSVGSFDPQKPVPDMTYNVFSGTLNPTHSINPIYFTASASI